jgi:hypothetical protein
MISFPSAGDNPAAYQNVTAWTADHVYGLDFVEPSPNAFNTPDNPVLMSTSALHLSLLIYVHEEHCICFKCFPRPIPLGTWHEVAILLPPRCSHGCNVGINYRGTFGSHEKSSHQCLHVSAEFYYGCYTIVFHTHTHIRPYIYIYEHDVANRTACWAV